MKKLDTGHTKCPQSSGHKNSPGNAHESVHDIAHESRFRKGVAGTVSLPFFSICFSSVFCFFRFVLVFFPFLSIFFRLFGFFPFVFFSQFFPVSFCFFFSFLCFPAFLVSVFLFSCFFSVSFRSFRFLPVCFCRFLPFFLFTFRAKKTGDTVRETPLRNPE